MYKLKRHQLIKLVFIIVIISIVVAFYYPLRSYIVMKLFSAYNQNKSVMRENDIIVQIPGGNITKDKDWYPFVNTFNSSEGFSRFISRDVDLTVLYNFGAFEGRSSTLYAEDSKYFSSFYGAYVLKNNEDTDEKYGFREDKLDINQIVDVTLYDYTYLVLYGFGCINSIFDVVSYETIENVSYIGYNDWIRIDAVIYTNSPTHDYDGSKLSYIQYGKPIKTDKEDFFWMYLQGRMYVRYFDEFKSTIVMYVMAGSQDTINECDDEILKQTIIKNK